MRSDYLIKTNSKTKIQQKTNIKKQNLKKKQK